MVKIETKRLILQDYGEEDFNALAGFLKNPEVMYAWGHGFSDEEVDGWLRRNMQRQKETGGSMLLAREKETGNAVGTMGLVYSDIAGHMDWEVAYILDKPYWRKGFAYEGAAACVGYAFEKLGAPRVLVQMRINNESSVNVAEKLGGEYLFTYDRTWNGHVWPHFVYVIEKDKWRQNVSRETSGENG